MARPIDQVVRNYELQLRCKMVGRARSGTVEAQVQHYAVAQAHNYTVVVQVKNLLDQIGVSVIWYPYYHSFARQVDKCVRSIEFSAEARRKEASLIVDHWTARGLNRAILVDICYQVFNISLEPPGAQG
jgi:hypothetical protein